MKLQILAVSILMSLMVNGFTYLPLGHTDQDKVEAQLQEIKDEQYGSKYLVEESNTITELVMVQSKADKGYLVAQPLEENSELFNGYILDDKYQLGDIVEITYDHDDLVSERLITDNELEIVYNEFGRIIDYLMDEGMDMDYALIN
jgi:hypothetical protein